MRVEALLASNRAVADVGEPKLNHELPLFVEYCQVPLVLLTLVTAMPDDEMSLVYRGDGWNVQYAVAKGARLAAGKGGDLWYTSDKLATLEYLETFRADRSLTAVH